MTYRFALERENHEHLASGGVLRSAPGFPAFPIRLGSEMLRRALAVAGPPAIVWDPCCGSGYLLTVLGLKHRAEIDRVIGTDVEPAAVALARRNLALLTGEGLAARSVELREMGERFAKVSYARASLSAQRLARDLAAQGGDVPSTVAKADVFDADELRLALGDVRPNVVITDVPYGEQSSWAGTDAGIEGMLRSLAQVLDDGAVIAVATRGRKVRADAGLRRLTSFRVGSRAVALFSYSRAVPATTEGTP